MESANSYSMAELTAKFIEQQKAGAIPLPGKRREYKRKKGSDFVLGSRHRLKMTVKYKFGTPQYKKHEKYQGRAIYHSYDLQGTNPVILDEKRGAKELVQIVYDNAKQILSARIFCSTDNFPNPLDTNYHIEIWHWYRVTGKWKNPTLEFLPGKRTERLNQKFLINLDKLEKVRRPNK